MLDVGHCSSRTSLTGEGDRLSLDSRLAAEEGQNMKLVEEREGTRTSGRVDLEQRASCPDTD